MSTLLGYLSDRGPARAGAGECSMPEVETLTSADADPASGGAQVRDIPPLLQPSQGSRRPGPKGTGRFACPGLRLQDGESIDAGARVPVTRLVRLPAQRYRRCAQ